MATGSSLTGASCTGCSMTSSAVSTLFCAARSACSTAIFHGLTAGLGASAGFSGFGASGCFSAFVGFSGRIGRSARGGRSGQAGHSLISAASGVSCFCSGFSARCASGRGAFCGVKRCTSVAGYSLISKLSPFLMRTLTDSVMIFNSHTTPTPSGVMTSFPSLGMDLRISS